MTLRLLQHRADDGSRSVIADDGRSPRLVNGVGSIRELAQQAIEAGIALAEMVASRAAVGGLST